MMMRQSKWAGFAAALLVGAGGLFAATNDPAPEFKEVYDLLRTHLKTMDASALNQAAVQGLLYELQSKVTLLPPETSSGSTNVSGLRKTNLYEGKFLFVQLAQLAPGSAQGLREAWQAAGKTNSLQGLILDLRFASGMDYAAAAAVADLFFATERPLADWGAGLRQATVKPDALAVPLAILVNGKTAGAAEVLAGILRENGIGLLLGSASAGQAHQFDEFKLATGQRLRIATAPVKLGGTKEIPATGLKPDIAITVRSENEKLLWEDAYATVTPETTLTRTNLAARAGGITGTNANGRRLNEAELVRRHREGIPPEDELPATGAGGADARSAGPTLQDPVLARALDLLKGLTLIHLKPNR